MAAHSSDRGRVIALPRSASGGWMAFLLLLFPVLLGLSPAAAQTGCAPDSPNYPCVYVANNPTTGTGSVSAVNATTNTVVATIPVGILPGGVALTPDNAFAYVVNSGTGNDLTLLGSAATFAVLATSDVNNLGGATNVYGDLGVSPGGLFCNGQDQDICGFPPGIVHGTEYDHDRGGVAARAQTAAAAAFTTLAALGCTMDITSGELGGLMLTPGVYCFTTNADLTGTLNLNFQGTDNAKVVFRIPNTLTTAASSSVVVNNTAQNDHVYWQVGSASQGASVTLGASSDFVGVILSDANSGGGGGDITLNSGAKITSGGAFGINTEGSFRSGAVTMDTNIVTNCAGGSVSVIATASNTVTATVPLQTCATQIAITPDGAFAYVVESATSQIDVIDTSTNQIVNTILLASGANPTAIAFTPDGAFAYVAASCDGLACAEVINTVTLQVVSSIPLSGTFPVEPASIAITPDGSLACMSIESDQTGHLGVAFISTGSAHGVTELDLGDNALVSNYAFGITPAGILYVAEQKNSDGIFLNSVFRVDPVLQTFSKITVGIGPTGVAVGPGGTLVYVTNTGDNTLSIINTKTNSVLTIRGSFSAPQGVGSMTLSPPTITTQPASQLIMTGNTATMSVVAASPAPVTYQWFQGQSGDMSNPIEGANGSSFTTPALTMTTSYWVLVSNVAGSVDSLTATITVVVGHPPTCSLVLQGTETSNFIGAFIVKAIATCVDPQGKALTTTIDWGDGSPIQEQAGGLLTLTHQYNPPLMTAFTVTVTATDTLGLQGSITESLTLVPASQVPPVFSGQSSQFTISVVPLSTALVSFECTTVTDSSGNVMDASAVGISCSSNPSQVSFVANVNKNVTFVIQTTAGVTGSLRRGRKHGSAIYALWLPMPGLLFLGLGVGRSRRKTISQWLALLVAVALLLIFMSCGGGFTLPRPAPTLATPPGNYQVTIVDNPVPGTNPTGFVQISLIVPLTVSQTQ